MSEANTATPYRRIGGETGVRRLVHRFYELMDTLPDARALLYSACIDLLLIKWRQPRDEPDLIVRLGLSRFRSGGVHGGCFQPRHPSRADQATGVSPGRIDIDPFQYAISKARHSRIKQL